MIKTNNKNLGLFKPRFTLVTAKITEINMSLIVFFSILSQITTRITSHHDVYQIINETTPQTKILNQI